MTLTPNWSAPTAPFRHTFSPIANVDQFRWLVRADQRQHLALARDELGVRFVRACAMYSPEMRVWDYDLPDWRLPPEQKRKRANWQLVDYGLEGLMELGLKPIYTTSFTPADFTDSSVVCWPDKNATGMPRDLNQWADFVAGGLRHHVQRYGLAEVLSWPIECWNEPNLIGCFWGGTKEEFFRLWSATWRAVKSVHPDLRFGGPSTARGEWFDEFLDFAQKDGTTPDYYITHVYNNDSESQPLSPFDGPASHKVKDSPHFATGVIKGLRKRLDERGFAGEVHWNEWGRSWFPHDPLKETPLEAAFVAKTMGEVSQLADAFGFWSLSDIYDQAGYQSSEFQAHYGLLSLHGLRKPAYQAHQLLCRLGTTQVPVAGGSELEGAVATPTERGSSVLVWRYPSTPEGFTSKSVVTVKLPAATKRATVYRIDRHDNNILSAWRDLGCPAYPTPRQLADLKAQNGLRPTTDVVVEHRPGCAEVRFELECPGVALVEGVVS